MMAACQPFVSGAISKTVNMPRDTKVEDISDAYMQAWKLGLKALAVYRDGSKSWQPANTSKREGIEGKVNGAPAPVRRRLPDTRPAVTHHFAIRGGGKEQPDGSFKSVDHEGYFTLGFHEDGTPGELFITMAKEGSQVSGLMDILGTLVSMSLQYGVPLEAMVEKFADSKFEPSGLVVRGDKDNIHTASSIPDYIFRAANNIANNFKVKVGQNPNGKNGNGESSPNGNGDSNGKAEIIAPVGMCPSCNRLSLTKGAGCEKVCSCGYQDYAGCGG
jgi:ribonucleoside-diphosphate reductase alpha chain